MTLSKGSGTSTGQNDSLEVNTYIAINRLVENTLYPYYEIYATQMQ